MSQLFSPLTLGQLTLDNRIVIAPMCQYSANDGAASDWHTIHLGQMSLSGAGLLILTPVRDKPHYNSLILFTMLLPVPAEAYF